VFIKLRDNKTFPGFNQTQNTKMSELSILTLTGSKIVSGFSQTQQYISFYFYLEDMFRSTDLNQAIFTKFRIICTACTLL
jgi:hypothetical protein